MDFAISNHRRIEFGIQTHAIPRRILVAGPELLQRRGVVGANDARLEINIILRKGGIDRPHNSIILPVCRQRNEAARPNCRAWRASGNGGSGKR